MAPLVAALLSMVIPPERVMMQTVNPRLRSTMPVASHGAIRVSIAIIALLVYALLALSWRQAAGERAYDIEREPIAVAISHIVYGAPIGAEFEGLRDIFIKSNAPVEHELTAVRRGKADLGDLLPHTLDGLGVGYPLFATAALLLFGVKTNSLIVGVLCLQGLAILAFLFRFADGRTLVIPLYFTALAAMLITPIGTDSSVVSQVPIGGYRYFALLAVIPALHVALEMIDKADRPPVMRRLCILTVQTVLLVCVYIVNASVLYVSAPIILIAACLVIWRRKKRGLSVLLAAEIGSVLAVAMIAYGGFHSAILASYQQPGKIGDLFWHRIFISYGVNPAWPFGSLAETYSACKHYIPEGLIPGVVDRNGQCVWITYVVQTGLSKALIPNGIYGVEYEKAMKAAFFHVLYTYPCESLKTFLYYKPMMLIETVKALMTCSSDAGILRYAIVIIEALLLVGLANLENLSWRLLITLAAAIATTGAGTLSLYFAAWSNTWTSSDLLCYLFMLIGLVPVAAICVHRSWRDEGRALSTLECG